MLRKIISAILILIAVFSAGGCMSSGRDRELVAEIDNSLAKAGKFMLSKQSPDGAWRSETYGALKNGPALTPYVMSALFFLPQTGPDAIPAYRRGTGYLCSFMDEKGGLKIGERELLFPVYSSASASRVVRLLEPTECNLKAQKAWLKYLLERQLDESLGWEKDDPEYGGWGYSIGRPGKNKSGEMRERFHESNLSATIFGIAALSSAKVQVDEPAYGKALAFVKRCQNFSDDSAKADTEFDDGGFFFIPGDDAQNKAGIAGVDKFGAKRYKSYGSMTADGLRALLRCGLKPDHPRVIAACRWLEKNYSSKHNPGDFSSDREVIRDATYYYWVWAFAHACMVLRKASFDGPEGKVNWAEDLARELMRRQKPDGSWENKYTDAKEDDPLVATPWAAAGLAICRSALTHSKTSIESLLP